MGGPNGHSTRLPVNPNHIRDDGAVASLGKKAIGYVKYVNLYFQHREKTYIRFGYYKEKEEHIHWAEVRVVFRKKNSGDILQQEPDHCSIQIDHCAVQNHFAWTAQRSSPSATLPSSSSPSSIRLASR